MMLTKEELVNALNNEVRLILHLASKVREGEESYRPSEQQRSTLELLQYLAMMGGIHARAVRAEAFDMAKFGADWEESEAWAERLTLEEAKAEIGKLPAVFAELVGGCSDADLRQEINLFGSPATRGSMFVSMLLTHFAAYRMQLFLYLKASGHPELNTMNLWVGRDGKMSNG